MRVEYVRIVHSFGVHVKLPNGADLRETLLTLRAEGRPEMTDVPSNTENSQIVSSLKGKGRHGEEKNSTLSKSILTRGRRADGECDQKVTGAICFSSTLADHFQ